MYYKLQLLSEKEFLDHHSITPKFKDNSLKYK